MPAGRVAKQPVVTAAGADPLEEIVAGIRACRICRDAPSERPLPHEPRPVFRISATATDLHRQPGPGDAGPCFRRSLHRCVGRSPARLDGGRFRDLLRREPHRHHPHGFLLSRTGRRGWRSAATPRMRAGLARPPVRVAAEDRAAPRRRFLCTELAPCRPCPADAHRDRRQLARVLRRPARFRWSCRCRTRHGATMAG